MVKHYPGVLQVTTGLHSFDEVDAVVGPNFGHLEDKDLVHVHSLPWKPILLHHKLQGSAFLHHKP